MAEETISFDVEAQSPGWVSRWSWIPEGMVSMNSNFYSFYQGNLYLHDSNEVRNQFYGAQYPSSIKVVFNQDPTNVKSFMTISQDSTMPWNVETETDLSSGSILAEYFKEKEGGWFGYIRRIDGDISVESSSVQGIGSLGSIVSNVLSFSFQISAPVAVGDSVYRIVGNVLELVGVVESHTATTITITSPLTNTPTPGQYLTIVKNSVAESVHQRGSYMIVEMTITSDDSVELFSIASEAELSKP